MVHTEIYLSEMDRAAQASSEGEATCREMLSVTMGPVFWLHRPQTTAVPLIGVMGKTWSVTLQLVGLESSTIVITAPSILFSKVR